MRANLRDTSPLNPHPRGMAKLPLYTDYMTFDNLVYSLRTKALTKLLTWLRNFSDKMVSQRRTWYTVW